MFRGQFEHAIDSKGRLSVPAKFREILSTNYDERLIITNFDGCLWAFPAAEWQKIEDKVSSLPQMQDVVKAFQRVFISAAVESPVDGSGRIQLPPTLREYAGISRDVVLVGMTNRIEIWSKEKWLQAFDSAQKQLEVMGDKLAELGL